MRFSKRSKLSIILSLVALVAVVGAFAVSGIFRGAPSKANAAGGGLHGVNQPLHFRGTTSIKPAPPATSAPNSGSNEIQQEPNAGSSKSPVGGSGGGLPTTPPNPANSTVTSTNPGFSGFPGINHADQRLANNGNQFSLEPPDQGLCVGNGFILETVNVALAVYSTAAGHTIFKPVTTLNSFFLLPPNITRTVPPSFGPFLSDPKCYFDRATQTWFLTVLEIDVDSATGAFLGHAQTLIAVSQTNSPAGAWSLFAIDATDDGTNGTPSHPGCPCFGDQPLIGADANGFYITTNEFSLVTGAFNGAQVYAVSKTGIEAAATSGGTISLPTVVHIDASQALVPFGGLSYSIQPATSPGSNANEGNGGTEYFLSALDFTATLDNRIATWALTNSASLNSLIPSVTLSFTVIASETYGQPPAAKQKPGPRPLANAIKAATGTLPPLELLNSNDDRMNQVVFANGLLWAGVNTIVQGPKSPARVGTAYFIVAPSITGGVLSATVANQGYVSVLGNNVLFPSIGVTSAGKGVITFTLVGPNYFPSSAYIAIDASGTSGSVHIAGAGALPEDGFSGYAAFGGAGVARWGDYSAAVADGANVWFADEYIPNLPRTTLANWGTFVGKVFVG